MPRLRSTVVAIVSLIATRPLAAQQDSAGPDSTTAVAAVADGATSYRWRTAGGKYLDPTSFFSLHGYVDGVFAGRSRQADKQGRHH